MIREKQVGSGRKKQKSALKLILIIKLKMIEDRCACYRLGNYAPIGTVGLIMAYELNRNATSHRRSRTSGRA